MTGFGTHAVMVAAEEAAVRATTVAANPTEVIVTEARNAYAGLPQTVGATTGDLQWHPGTV